MVFTIPLDDFVMYGRGVADPWGRISCCRKPLLVMVEFCQIRGPQPVFHFPHTAATSNTDNHRHICLNEVSLWLMSSDNVHGSLSVLYNQSMGVYAIVQYSLVIDLNARGFQRPFALAYLTPDLPKPGFIRQFQIQAVKLFMPFLACNRHYIRTIIQHFTMIDEDKQKLFIAYHKLCDSNETFTLLSKRISSITKQAQNVYNRLFERSYFFNNDQLMGCECSFEPVNCEKFVRLLCMKSMEELVPLLEMSPCTGPLFKFGAEQLFKTLSTSGDGHRVSGLVFSGNTPVMRSFFGANSTVVRIIGLDPTEGEMEEDKTAESSDQMLNKKESNNTLKIFSNRLIGCLFPLFSGEKIAILASLKRSQLGFGLLKKLNFIRSGKSSEIVNWHHFPETERGRIGIETNTQLVGIQCDRECSLEWDDPRMAVIVDLNNRQIRCRKYSGKFLQSLAGRRLLLFPSDKVIAKFIAAVISDIHQSVVLAKYTTPHLVIRQLKMDIPDQLIFFNFLVELDVTKYSRLKLESETKSKFLPCKTITI